MENNSYLLNEKTSKLLLKFSLPCIFSLLISALYNIVDQIFIGNSFIGSIGNTATSIVFPLTCIALAFGLMLGDGAASYMSLKAGKKENDKIHLTVGTSLIAGLVVSIIFLLICFPLLSNILVFFGAKTEESLNYSYEYGFIILIGVPFYILMNLMNAIIRADGSPKISMISMTTGALINIILDPILISVCSMGMAGAALATIIGQISSFIISFIYIFNNRFTKTFKLKLNSFIYNNKDLIHILQLGLSSFLTQVSIVILSIVSMNELAKYGANSKYGVNDPQAIFGIVMKVFTIVVNISVGIASGAQPIIGYNYGAKRYDRVKQLLNLIIISNIIVGAIATLLFQLFPGQIVSIFGSNSDNLANYYEFGIMTIRIYLSLVSFTLIQKVTAIYLQSTGHPVKATLLSLLRDVVTIIPFMVLLPLKFGIVGVLYSSIFSDVISFIVTLILLVIEYKNLNKYQRENVLELQEQANL
jgi:putative MATE family efflux protein